MELVIEKAKLEDGCEAAKLVHIAYGNMSYKLLGTNNLKEVLRLYKKLWENSSTRFSWENSYVIKKENRVIALMTYCHGKEVNKLNSNTVKILLKENFFRYTWYILTHLNYYLASLRTVEAENHENCLLVLGVNEKFQGLGLGGKLIKYFIDKEGDSRKTFSVLCSASDSKAIEFYEKQSFTGIKLLKNSLYNYLKMEKRVE